MDNLSAAGQISAAGMTAQRRRVEILMSNLVHSNTTKAAVEEAIGRKDVVFAATPINPENFKKAMDAAIADANSVEIAKVVTVDREPIKRYEPNHPHANKDGYVLYPNIEPMEEMVNIVSATRSYQANLEARKRTGDMKDSALSILK
jgi:flagellar basal-body rod protein FlgC